MMLVVVVGRVFVFGLSACLCFREHRISVTTSPIFT